MVVETTRHEINWLGSRFGSLVLPMDLVVGSYFVLNKFPICVLFFKTKIAIASTKMSPLHLQMVVMVDTL